MFKKIVIIVTKLLQVIPQQNGIQSNGCLSENNNDTHLFLLSKNAVKITLSWAIIIVHNILKIPEYFSI